MYVCMYQCLISCDIYQLLTRCWRSPDVSGEEGRQGGAEGAKKNQDQEARQAAAHQAHLGQQEEVIPPWLSDVTLVL